MTALTDRRKQEIDSMVEILRYTWYANHEMDLGELVTAAAEQAGSDHDAADQTDQVLVGGLNRLANDGTIRQARAQTAALRQVAEGKTS